MQSCCFHLKYMIIIKVFLRMVLVCIMVSNQIFLMNSNKWQIKLKFHHDLLFWLNLIQCLEVTLILVLFKNSLDDYSIISKSCLIVTHLLISFLTSIWTIVWKMALSCYLMMTHHYLVSLVIASRRTMTTKNNRVYIALISFSLISKMHNQSM